MGIEKYSKATWLQNHAAPNLRSCIKQFKMFGIEWIFQFAKTKFAGNIGYIVNSLENGSFYIANKIHIFKFLFAIIGSFSSEFIILSRILSKQGRKSTNNGRFKLDFLRNHNPVIISRGGTRA